MVHQASYAGAGMEESRETVLFIQARGGHRWLCSQGARAIRDVTMDLNDHHKWTREQIANWLEQEEEKLGYVTLVEKEAEESELVTV